jgi:beta-glucosidase
LSNLLKAHVAVYQAIKGMPGGAYTDIGLVHNFLKFIPRYDVAALRALTNKISVLTNDIVMQFLSTGCIDEIDYYDPLAVESYDFTGLNFYANPIISFSGPSCFPGDIMGDMYLRIDPKGFEDAIRQFAALKKPIYITETGIASNKDDCIRKEFIIQFLEVFERLQKEGLDLRGFYYWSFVKNREWNEGDTKDFGLFKPNREKRPSTLVYEEFMQKHQDPVVEEEYEGQTFRLV